MPSVMIQHHICCSNAETELDGTEYVAEINFDVQLWKYYKDKDKHTVLSWMHIGHGLTLLHMPALN